MPRTSSNNSQLRLQNHKHRRPQIFNSQARRIRPTNHKRLHSIPKRIWILTTTETHNLPDPQDMGNKTGNPNGSDQRMIPNHVKKALQIRGKCDFDGDCYFKDHLGNCYRLQHCKDKAEKE